MISMTFSVGGVSQIGNKVVKESWLGKKGLKVHDGSKGGVKDVKGLKNYVGSKKEVKESQQKKKSWLINHNRRKNGVKESRGPNNMI